MAMNHAFHLTWRRGSPQTGAAARRRLPAAHVLPAARRDRDRSRLRFGAFCGLVGGSERGPHFFPSSPVDLGEPADGVRARVLAAIAWRGMLDVWAVWRETHASAADEDLEELCRVKADYVRRALEAGLQAVDLLPRPV